MRLRAHEVFIILLVVMILGCSSGKEDQSYSLRDSVEPSPVSETSEHPQPALPIGWRIGEIDPRFGLSEAEVRDAVEKAVALWEGAVEGDLFVYDPAQGIPINLKYDHRQERRLEYQQAKAKLKSLLTLLEHMKAEVQKTEAEAQRVHAHLKQRQKSLNDAIQQHNKQVREWNLRGGAPPDVMQELYEERARLEQSANQLRWDEALLKASQQKADRYIDEYNSLAKKYNSLAAEFNERFGEGWQEEAGKYESISSTSGFQNSSITVFVAETLDHLALVLAHELGHALGIKHIEDEPSALMSPSTPHEESQGYRLHLTEADIAALKAALTSQTRPPSG